MGTFTVTVGVARTQDGPFETLEAFVDSGSFYTVIPTRMLDRLGVRRVRSERFVLADGRHIERQVGGAWFRVRDEIGTSMVVFGAEDDQPLLGAVTLEAFGLLVDPRRQELVKREELPMMARLRDLGSEAAKPCPRS